MYRDYEMCVHVSIFITSIGFFVLGNVLVVLLVTPVICLMERGTVNS